MLWQEGERARLQGQACLLQVSLRHCCVLSHLALPEQVCNSPVPGDTPPALPPLLAVPGKRYGFLVTREAGGPGSCQENEENAFDKRVVC